MPKSLLLWAPVLGVAGYACGFLLPEPDPAFPEASPVVEIIGRPASAQVAGTPASTDGESHPGGAEFRELVAGLEALDADGLAARYLALIDGGKGRNSPEKRREILLTLIRWAEIDAEHGKRFFAENCAEDDPFSAREENEGLLPFEELDDFASVVQFVRGPDETDTLRALELLALSDPRAAVAWAVAGELDPFDWGDFLGHLTRVGSDEIWNALPVALQEGNLDDPFGSSLSSFSIQGLAHQDIDRLLAQLEANSDATSTNDSPSEDTSLHECARALPLDVGYLQAHLGSLDHPSMAAELIEHLVQPESLQWIADGAAGLSEDSVFDRLLVTRALEVSDSRNETDALRLAERLPLPLLESLYAEGEIESVPENALGLNILLRLSPPALPAWLTEDAMKRFSERLESMVPLSFPAHPATPPASGYFFWDIPRPEIPTVANFLSRRTDLPPEKLAAYATDWAESDPAAAARWITGLSAEPARIAGMKAVMENWAPSDLEASSRWLAKQPTGAARDEGALILVDELAGYDRVAAAAWAAEIGDAELRAIAEEAAR